MLGIVLVDKPKGMSSHDAVYRLRRALGIRKIGHAGTLDPLATGLLVMAVGDATRFLPYLTTNPKTYRGAAQLGRSTTTQDSEGETVEEFPCAHVGYDEVAAACSEMTGQIRQVPPMYSAVKVGGKRLYKMARQGVELDRQTREVLVSQFSCLSYDRGRFEFEVTCSSGTYVRTLVHDLGANLGVGAHMTELRRLRAGAFDVAAAKPPEEVTADDVLPLEQALAPLPCVPVPPIAVAKARNGNDVALHIEVDGDTVCLLDDGEVFAIAKRMGSFWRPIRCVPIEKKSPG